MYRVHIACYCLLLVPFPVHCLTPTSPLFVIILAMEIVRLEISATTVLLAQRPISLPVSRLALAIIESLASILSTLWLSSSVTSASTSSSSFCSLSPSSLPIARYSLLSWGVAVKDGDSVPNPNEGLVGCTRSLLTSTKEDACWNSCITRI